MAPVNVCVVPQLQQLIYYHIDNNSLENGLFFAERLFAYDSRSPESAYLLALCHFRLRDYASAYEHAKSAGTKGTSLGCTFIYAQACLALERYKDGTMVLEKLKGLWHGRNSFGKHTSSSRHLLPDAAAINCLLGKLYFGYDNKQKATHYFEEALKLNPFMWDAFTNLADMGAEVRLSAIFKMSSEMDAMMKTTAQEYCDTNPQSKESSHHVLPDQERSRNGARPNPVVNDTPDPFHAAPSRGFAGGLFGTLGVSQKLNESNPSLTNLPAAVGNGSEIMETPTGSNTIVDITAVHHRRDAHATSMPTYPSEPPQAPVRKSRTIQGLGINLDIDVPRMSRGVSSKRPPKIPEYADDSAATQSLRHTNLLPTVGERKRTASGQVAVRQTSEDPGAPIARRSVRLFNKERPTTTKPVVSTLPNVGPPPGRELKKTRQPIGKLMQPYTSRSTVGRQVSGNRKHTEDSMDLDQKESNTRGWISTMTSLPAQKSNSVEIPRPEDALRYLLDLFKRIGNGYYALSKFRCTEAIQIYKALPKSQQETPWVLAQIGRAYYEQASYAEAEKYYKRLRHLAPTRFEDMEIFSTILWHLKRETDLAFLAHELIDSSWQSPQAWCALGNSWSLARDHEQALRCFKRATQLSPKFAYAFTLQGHEHVANEEYEKAQTCYRAGMAADHRHYNAWYGVGRVYDKLGNYDKAIAHFTAASQINPTNAVLICCIGTVLEKQKQPKEALKYYTQATELAPRSTLTRFKKARTLMSIGDLDRALHELIILKDLAPEEPMVHFLLGRLYKSLREKGLAVRHFTIALNLDPKVIPHFPPYLQIH